MSSKQIQKTPSFFGAYGSQSQQLPQELPWKESEGTLLRAVNMRRDKTVRHIWRPAPLPTIVRSDSWRPLQRLRLPGSAREVIFMQSGTMLGFTQAADSRSEASVDGSVTEIGVLEGTPLFFSTVEAGTVRVLMQHSPAIYLTYSVSAAGTITFTNRGTMPPLPDMSLTVTGETTLSEPVTAMTLSGNGPIRTSLNPADTATVTSRLLSAYTRLYETAAESGCFIQPTLARYRLLDAAGDTIFVSPTVMLSPAGGFQCCGEITLSSPDSLQSLNSGALTARAYRVKLTCGSALPTPWSHIVKSVVVESAGEIDPVDTSRQAHSTVSTTGSVTTVKLHLPGVNPVAASFAVRMHTRVVRTLCQNRFTAHAIHTYPFSTAGKTFDVSMSQQAVASVPEAGRFMGAVLRDNVCHAVCSRVGDLLLKADTLTLPFQGYSPAAFAVERGNLANTRWQGVATVTIVAGDGSSRLAVAPCDGGDIFNPTGEPTAFSPLLTYPDTSATQITLTATRTDATGAQTVVTETYPLSPLPQAGIAYYLDPALAPITPRSSASKLIVPEPNLIEQRNAGELTVCRATGADAPMSVANVCPGQVLAVAESPRNRSSWDFARTRILLFGPFGTMVATLGNDFNLRSAATIDTRPVTSAASVSGASTQSGAVILAIAGGDLISIGSGAVKTLLCNCKAECAGICTAHNEILLSAAGKTLRRIAFDSVNSGEQPEIDIPDVENITLMQFENHTYAAAANALLDVETDSFPQSGLDTTLTLRHRLPRLNTDKLKVNRITHAMLRLFASNIHGWISFAADNGSRNAETLLTMRLGQRTTTTFASENNVSAPIFVPAIIPRSEWLETTVKATMSADAEWHPVEFVQSR